MNKEKSKSLLSVPPIKAKKKILPFIVIHYLVSLLFIVIGQLIGVIYVAYQALPLYVFLSFISIQMFRLGEKFQGYSEIAILMTNVPFIPFLYMSQSRHKEYSVLWLTSIFLVILQSATQGRQDFRFANITLFSTTFIVSYSVLTATLPTVLNNSTWVYYTISSPSSSFALDATIEIIFAFGLSFLAWSLISLRDHIGVYGEKMNERQDLITQIKVKNNDLKVELDKELSRTTQQQSQLEGGNFISPISKVIKIIRDIQVNAELDDETVDDLDYVVHLLLSNQLFKPQLMNSNMESEVNQWLKQITENDIKEETSMFAAKNTGLLRKVTRESSDRNSQIGFHLDTTPDIEKILDKINVWDFPIFDLVDATKCRPLYFMGMQLVELYKFDETFGIPIATYSRFFHKLEASYRKSNPYHNSTHAADVMQSMHFFLNQLEMKDLLQAEEVYACLLATAIHDVDHPGFNNSFLITTLNPIALRYNDQSVLENYHCAKGYELMVDPENNILSTLNVDQYKVCRTAIISMVLSTDMINHFEYITKFKNKVNGEGLDVKDNKSRSLLMDVAIKCADISNVCKNSRLSMKWTHLVMEEFFRQGDEERKLRMPVSPLMDRYNISVSKCQLGFIDFIVFPLYEHWTKYMDDDTKFPAMQNLLANREFWKNLSELGPVSVKSDK